MNPPVLFLGAGASAPFDVPPMREMVDLFEKELQGEQLSLWNRTKQNLMRAYGTVDIEHMLSFFSRPYVSSSELDPPTVCLLPNLKYGERIDIVDQSLAQDIVERLKAFIYIKCSISGHNNIFPLYERLLNTLGGACNPRSPDSSRMLYTSHDFEVYTTNYDRCFEIFFREAANRYRNDNIVLDQGIGRKDYWNFDYYENQYPKIYKLHGSIGRYVTSYGRIRTCDRLMEKRGLIDGEEIVEEWMIWPLTGKYLYRFPYSQMLDRFRNALLSNNFWVFVGYSFRDEGINLILKDVNDRLLDMERRGVRTQARHLFLLDRDASAKKASIQENSMIHFDPIDRAFDANAETYEELRTHISNALGVS